MTPGERPRPVRTRPRPAAGTDLERMLERVAQQWRTTFDAIAAPVLTLDTGGRILRLNRAARDLTESTFQQLLGRPVAEVGGGVLLETAAAAAIKAVESRSTASAQVTDAAGTVWDVVAQFRGRAGEVDFDMVVVVTRDITQLVALQERLRRTEMLSALGGLVAGIAHQVRNPLFGISAALDAFEARFGDRAEVRPYVAAIRDPATRLGKLLGELVEYARPAALQRLEVDLRQVAVGAIRANAEAAARRRVTVDPPPLGAPLPVLADPDRLQDALASVVANAVEASEAEGLVEITVERAGASGEERALVRVRDHGPGFRAEDIPHLGEPFFARRHGGTGLGLALTQRVVFEHGGRLRFANAAGGGAEVEVTLPLQAGARREE